jgi:2-dehydro-3-deoxyphosphogluconate aldolase / (4S)-4-hydroxy-2-oxoglutarate aldolase
VSAAPSVRDAQREATRRLARAAGVLPVLTVVDAARAVHVAAALARGGLTAIEVTLRSAAALQAIDRIRHEVPGVAVGAGTVRSARQAQEALDHGAQFIVTPGTPPALSAALATLALPVVPGAATASEMMALMDLGFDVVKFFPAASAGGLGAVRALAAPLPELALVPTGGIDEASAADYLRQPNVLCVGGSWMVRPEWIAADRFEQIEECARRARALVEGARAGA